MSCSGGIGALSGWSAAAGKAVPSKSLRAVRTTPERTTRGGVDGAVDDDVDQQVAGGVLDVDLRACRAASPR